jgi:hypothetical protein
MDADAARAILAKNAQDLRKFALKNLAELTEGFDDESHAVSSAYVEKVTTLVDAVLRKTNYDPALKDELNRELREALASVRYITFADLSRATDENIALLQESRGRSEYCLMVPTGTTSSVMWFTLLAAVKLAPMYAACANCGRDVVALNTVEKMDCLFFDGCIFSGQVVLTNLRRARSNCRTQTFYCVPAFWHDNTPGWFESDIHPRVRAALAARSRDLKRATAVLGNPRWNVSAAYPQTLTLLQTEQPNEEVFPMFLFSSATSPFVDPYLTALYDAELGALSIAQNCSGRTGCPPALYKDTLKSLMPSEELHSLGCSTDAFRPLMKKSRQPAAMGGLAKSRSKTRRAKSRSKTRRTKSRANTRRRHAPNPKRSSRRR